MTTIEKINKYKPLSLDEIIQENEKRLQELESFNKIDKFCYNIIRRLQFKPNYNDSIYNLKDSLYREYLAKYDEEHSVKYLGCSPERFNIVNILYDNNRIKK